jgi:hypothetical protein
VLQHRPSTHVLFEHMAFREHTPPCPSLATHVVPLQKKAPMQSESVAQLPWHAVSAALHGWEPQGTWTIAGQAPAAVQTAGAVDTAFGGARPLQDPARHATPGFGVLHAPPWHVFLWHTLPSCTQAVPFASDVFEHPVVALHTSVVQSFESLQSELFGVPAQVLPLHESPVVHATLSLQPPTKLE